MSSGWLERSLLSLRAQAQNWPDWKREAVSTEPQLAIPPPKPASTEGRAGEALAVSNHSPAQQEAKK